MNYGWTKCSISLCFSQFWALWLATTVVMKTQLSKEPLGQHTRRPLISIVFLHNLHLYLWNVVSVQKAFGLAHSPTTPDVHWKTMILVLLTMMVMMVVVMMMMMMTMMVLIKPPSSLGDNGQIFKTVWWWCENYGALMQEQEKHTGNIFSKRLGDVQA